MSDNQPILCIPRVYPNITEERIRRVFGDLDLGEVTQVDIKSKTTDKGEKFNRVFIHINWNESEQSIAVRERLLAGKDIKIIYDEPWFWRVSAYRPPSSSPKLVFETSDNRSILAIPGVFANIKEERIRRIFEDLNIGDVERVDIVAPKIPDGGKENKFNRVFIHINWNDNPNAVDVRERLAQGKEIKIIYDEPWFWKVSAYRPPAPKPKFVPKPKPKVFQPKKATIQLDFEPEVQRSGTVAAALSIQLPDVIAPLGPKSPTTPPPADLVPVKQEPLDYGNVPAVQKKKKVIIESDSK